ncbi:MAG: hypothetical protein AVDCRST_MAG45-666 [uncultured Solirubrobacterales bacterium]|uniref:Uncharacterized protein n=1 Tax=uncultured Solirubrobacterales bacterium TaxID=768556 RepID=A0A6J4SED4_9ACTN|nr:MAG: hypothetical protein AVDCRST_MAG45-666 [uncultured Solirubrobacterales bacterium]
MTSAPSSPPSGASTEPDEKRDFDVFRLRVGDVIALLAAFALLFTMAGDWYSTSTGEEAREIVERQGTEGPGSGIFDDGAVEDARVEAEQAERNAWQVSSPVDLLALLALLATIGGVFASAALHASGREYPELGRSPRSVAALLALLALLLLVVQAALRLDADSEVTIKIGLPLGVAALGMIACGTGLALRDAQRPPVEETPARGPATAEAPEARRA